jgi:hypothetical protein
MPHRRGPCRSATPCVEGPEGSEAGLGRNVGMGATVGVEAEQPGTLAAWWTQRPCVFEWGTTLVAAHGASGAVAGRREGGGFDAAGGADPSEDRAGQGRSAPASRRSKERSTEVCPG